MLIKSPTLLLIVFLPLLVNCKAIPNTTSPIPSVTYLEIVSGDNNINGRQENKKITVFSDQASLNSALAIYIQSVTEHTVDFHSSQAALLSMGGRSSGGYSIGAEYVEDHGDYIELGIVLTKPGDSCFTNQMLTSPYQFIEIKSTKKLIINERVVVADCNQ